MAARYSVEESKGIHIRLQRLGLPALDELFRSGKVPNFEDIKGETSGAWLAKPARDYWWADWFIKVFLASPWARWTGKVFLTRFDRKLHGRGANLFSNRIRPVRYRLETFIKRAEVDENDCLTLRYPFGSIMYGLIDDVRQIEDGVLLGQMHYKFPWQRGRIFIGYFVLCVLGKNHE
ncbi:hypothetical protein [Mesorhizobium sp.]|uniref:hypothetical protein n=1 Tax=Mesorhizobium sp. TaxID=1871066 RepID=UPI00122944C2|nr:hypothetical protein [Mesorhizobium sp.]TIL43296.1 MAG: hypothetical protein E5Y86_22925 [Mesorhizobium sp.]